MPFSNVEFPVLLTHHRRRQVNAPDMTGYPARKAAP